ncbi:MAG: 2-amino-4-hydroxy-6-hydroxymethyldihydropteridine diphosphokinase [Candidatus Omnitrophota bacterium]
MAIIFAGIGSNIGDKKANLDEAIKRLEEEEEIRITAKSSFYETRPVGGPRQEDYLNGVIKIETSLSPESCLVVFKAIEKDMGRVPAGRSHPRAIDLDILFYEDLVMETGELAIPHPRLQERYFVLRGLAEIAPDAVHPVLGKTVRELYEGILDNGVSSL